MFAAKNGSAIRALWEGDTSAYGGDDSRADAALLAHLAFYCRKDAALMESMFSRSGLGQRDKWTERPDYRERSIANAISLTGEVYSGRRAVTFGPVPSSPGAPPRAPRPPSGSRTRTWRTVPASWPIIGKTRSTSRT